MEPSAKVIADSIGPNDQRVTTMEVTMHRFVLAEFNTHRVFSRNSASSRAIPAQKQVEAVFRNPAYPLVWASEKKGMQGGPDLEGEDLLEAQQLFERVSGYVANEVELYLNNHPLDEEGSVRLHKSLLNRLLEPFLWHKVIVTSTEWSNFFGLRCHSLAQPEMRIAAEKMQEAYLASAPREIDYLEWHLPYVSEEEKEELTAKNQKIVSAARCAWVSTESHDKDHSLDACRNMFDRLTSADPIHASPFEHQCTPIGRGVLVPQIGNLTGFRQLRHYVERGWPLL
jgi:thymidylate synthase ThyX